MCGIVGSISNRNVAAILIDGLKRLEYRGYDSAGLAVIDENDQLYSLRTKGKVAVLADAQKQHQLKGQVGIAHTRWATHGEPSERNAHPQLSNQQFAVVHNGIIENHEQLRKKLQALDYTFGSETDTEVIAHLIHYYSQQQDDFLKGVQHAILELQGAYALGIINTQHPDKIIAVRKGSPLVVGIGIDENYIASDHLALASWAREFIFLEEGDIAIIERESIQCFDDAGNQVDRPVIVADINTDPVEKGEYRHYMQKEIFEQEHVIRDTLEGRLGTHRVLEEAFGEKAPELFDQVQRIQIVACGTSYHAGLVARYWFEEYANIPCAVEVASEIRYRKAVILPGTLFVCISQSGETADTLAALRQAKSQGYLATLAICNVSESTLVREADSVFMTRAGVEIGVASTKAFTTQLVALLLLTIIVGRRHGLDSEQEKILVEQIRQLPTYVQQALDLDSAVENLAESFSDKHHALFLGRGAQYPVALEGALKLKEISYIHAEAYPAGELKHGPLALVDKNMPVIAVAPNDDLLEKLKSNLHEVRARGGELIVFADAAAELTNGSGVYITDVPSVPKVLAPIVYTIPLQLLAYHVAVLKGTDVDQPRNLAKSVTVE